MISTTSVVAFAWGVFVLAVVPGPGVLACVSRALASGFRQALGVAMGIVAADLLFLLSALCGLAAMAELLGRFFMVVKYLGGVYLIWLGYRLWRSSGHYRALEPDTNRKWGSNFLSGFLLTLGNPKAIVFYLSLLSTIIDLDHLKSSDIPVYAVTLPVVLGSVLCAYIFLAHRIRSILHSRRAMKNVGRCSGAVIASVGFICLVRE
ncbi:MAG: LysE family translocator [Candidatus Zixiibacteriota bacterium]|nr:MAG: LysE family translocator [candidate division Zixibacteria bacterium]